MESALHTPTTCDTARPASRTTPPPPLPAAKAEAPPTETERPLGPTSPDIFQLLLEELAPANQPFVEKLRTARMKHPEDDPKDQIRSIWYYQNNGGGVPKMMDPPVSVETSARIWARFTPTAEAPAPTVGTTLSFLIEKAYRAMMESKR